MPGLSIRSHRLPGAALLLASALVSSGLGAADAPDLAALQARTAQGDASAEGLLCSAYFSGSGVPHDPAKARPLCERAAEADDPIGEQVLGDMYQQGRGVDRDYTLALTWLRKSAAHGDAVAERLLGVSYQQGLGVTANPVTAGEWYDKAAAGGDALAMYYLSGLYYYGQGRPKDVSRSFAMADDAALKGLPDAEMELSWFYANGVGVPQDPAEAGSWLRKAAEHGHVQAGCTLAVRHFSRDDATVSDTEALAWLDAGSRQDNLECMNNEAWVLATAKQEALRDPLKAHALALSALAERPDDPALLDTLAAVFAAQGKFDRAVAEEEEAMGKLPEGAKGQAVRANFQQRLDLYRKHQAYVDPGS